MKKPLLLSILSIALASGASAQIAITSGNIFGIGDTFSSSTDTNYTGTVNGGANQTWDFSNMTADETSSISAVDPAATANASDFPTATIAMSQTQNGQTSIAYMSVSNTEAVMLGAAGAFDLSFDDPQTIMEFPSTYNSSFADNSGYDLFLTGADMGLTGIVDSARIKSYSTNTTTFDAYGSLTTPLGTAEVIRAFETSVSTDSTWVIYTGTSSWSLLTSDSQTSYRHSYWTNDPSVKFPMMEYSTNSGGTSIEDNEVTFVSQVAHPLSVNKLTTQSFSVYPNPSNEVLNINSPYKIQEIQISDVMGRMVAIENNYNGKNIDVSNLGSGVYNISILSNGKWENRLFQKN